MRGQTAEVWDRLSETDGRAAGVGAGRDRGFHCQRSTMMLLDSMGNGSVQKCTFSPHLHIFRPNLPPRSLFYINLKT